MMLFIENSDLTQVQKEAVREAICSRLAETWTGKRVDRAFVASLLSSPPSKLGEQLDLADRLAPILTTSTKIAGNPRLIKRFLNTLSIRMAIAHEQNVSLDEAALAKMLLFERCGSERAYAELLAAINESDDGKARFLAPLESEIAKNAQASALEGEWNTGFIREWLALQPPLADIDLRGVVFVSKEHMPIITAADSLSSEGASILEALLKVTAVSTALVEKLSSLPAKDIAIVTDRLLARARTINQWGTPPILYSLLTVTQISGDHINVISRFLQNLPAGQLTPAIVPLLADKSWAKAVLAKWAAESNTKDTVKKAIASTSKKGGK